MLVHREARQRTSRKADQTGMTMSPHQAYVVAMSFDRQDAARVEWLDDLAHKLSATAGMDAVNEWLPALTRLAFLRDAWETAERKTVAKAAHVDRLSP